MRVRRNILVFLFFYRARTIITVGVRCKPLWGASLTSFGSFSMLFFGSRGSTVLTSIRFSCQRRIVYNTVDGSPRFTRPNALDTALGAALDTAFDTAFDGGIRY